jgi:hypothetical protein
MHKKAQAGTQITFVGFFILIVIVGTGIAVGTSFFAGEIDFRQAEATIIYSKIAKCFLDNDLSKITNAAGNDARLAALYGLCEFNSEAMKNSQGIKICVDAKDNDDCMNAANPFVYSVGTGVVISACGLSDKSDKFPKCVNNTFFKDNKKYTIYAISNQKTRRIVA